MGIVGKGVTFDTGGASP
ncbi:hypothetical protein ACFTAO_06975 [Paenibacillus rhizoplanae]